jgi:galactosylceramidase
VCSNLVAQKVDVFNLKCELKTNPTGITKARPSFSWTFKGDSISTKQGGFRIMMATSIEKLKYPDLWDRGSTSKLETGNYQYL